MSLAPLDLSVIRLISKEKGNAFFRVVITEKSTGGWGMNESSTDQTDIEKLHSLKRLATAVYLCQVLAFAFAGLPLLVGVIINFMRQDDVKGTFLESHFDWQIKTVWIALAGLALSGLTFELGIGLFILIATVVLMVYRIVVGWSALNSDRPVSE
jgi:uncharacterized membrane protein